MIKILLKALIVGVLITPIIGAIGYWRAKEMQKTGTVAPYADDVNIYLAAQAGDVIKDKISEISEDRSVQYTQSFGDRDIGLYLVRDWNLLGESGLLNYCGELCDGTKHLNLNRKIVVKNFVVVKKDLFLNLSDFTTLNPDGTSITFSPVDIDCLKQVLEREIRYLIPQGDTVLKCQHDLAQEKSDGVTNRTQSSNFRFTIGL